MKIKSVDKSLKVALFTSLGSGLEYYDFVIYGMMAKYFSDIFFSAQDETSVLIQTFAIFTVGYLVRPFGGTLVGMIADIYGRKKAFVVIMLTMAFSTIAIGLLPNYRQIGIAAPICLLLLRICQGLSFGAELPGATTIVSEFAPKNKLGKLCSLVISSTAIGAILASFILALLTNIFTHQKIIDGVWRIPFIIGGTLAIISYYIRQNLSETPEFLEQAHKTNNHTIITPFKLLWKEQLKELTIGFSLTFFIAVIVIINLYFPTYIHKYFEYKLADIYTAITVSLISSTIFLLIFGWISDRVSKLKMILFCLVSSSLTLFPLYMLLNFKRFWALQIFFIIYQLINAAYFTSYLPILSRLFSTNARYTGIALTYNIAFSLASTIPILASYFLEKYQSPYVLGIFFITAIILAFIGIMTLIIQNKGNNYVY